MVIIDVYGCLLMFIDVYGCLLMFIYLFNGNLFRFAMEHGWIHLAHGYTDDEATDGEIFGTWETTSCDTRPIELEAMAIEIVD